MRNHDHYPQGAALGACIITRDERVPPGTQVIDLDVELDDLPAWGRLMVSEKGVELLNVQLGWDAPKALRDKAAEQRETITRLQRENVKLRSAIESLFSAAEAVGSDLPTLLADVEADLAAEKKSAPAKKATAKKAATSK